jgi:hypothetical protein
MTTRYTLAELEHHLVYEIDMLNESCGLITKIDDFLEAAGASERERKCASNAMKEDFCLHARGLIEFFTAKGVNSASDFADARYSSAALPKDKLNQKLNNQIAHLMDNRTMVDSEKIGDQERADLLRWVNDELERWKPDRKTPYLALKLPGVDLSLIPLANAVIAIRGPFGPSSQFDVFLGITGPVNPHAPTLKIT